MAKKKVFYSFHFGKDVMRVQQVRNIGVIERNEQVTAQEWENAGKTAGGIEKWIDKEMKNKDCVVVLIGEDTHSRPWVKHEIKKAWAEGKGLVGIHIHNLNCPNNGKSTKGTNPFSQFNLSSVKCHDPKSNDAYGDIASNIETWVQAAVDQRK